MKRIIYLLAVVTFGCYLASYSRYKKDYSNAYQDGLKYMREGDYVHAADYFAHVGEDDEKYLYALAGAQLRTEQLGKAWETNPLLETTRGKLVTQAMEKMAHSHYINCCVRNQSGMFLVTYNKDETSVPYTEYYDLNGKYIIAVDTVQDTIKLTEKQFYDAGHNLIYQVTKINETSNYYSNADYFRVVDMRTDKESNSDFYTRVTHTYDYYFKDNIVIVSKRSDKGNTVKHYFDGRLIKIDYTHGVFITFESDEKERITATRTYAGGMLQKEALCDYVNKTYTVKEYDISNNETQPWYIHENYLSDKKTVDGNEIIITRTSYDYGKTYAKYTEDIVKHFTMSDGSVQVSPLVNKLGNIETFEEPEWHKYWE